MRACSAGNFSPFNTKTAKYEDNVVSWPSVEPADDYTANSLLAFAFAAGARDNQRDPPRLTARHRGRCGSSGARR